MITVIERKKKEKKRENASGHKGYLSQKPHLLDLLVNFVVDSREKSGFI